MTNSFWKVKALSWADKLASYVLWLLVTFLTENWGLSYNVASAILNVFSGITAISPFIIQHVADAFTGNYVMVLLTSLAYIIGLVLLAISTGGNKCNAPQDNAKHYDISIMQKILFYSGLLFLVIGASRDHLIRVKNLINEKGLRLSKWSRIFKVVVTVIVHVGGVTVIPILPEWWHRFGILAICMLVATVFFLTGSMHASSESINESRGSPLTNALRVLVASFLGRLNRSSTNSSETNVGDNNRIVCSCRLRCLDRATNNFANQNSELKQNRWRHCTVEEVEETKKPYAAFPFA